MEILGDRITILAEIAEWPDEIDATGTGSKDPCRTQTAE